MNVDQKLDAILEVAKRIEASLQAAPKSPVTMPPLHFSNGAGKGITLTGLARRSKLKNGQQRVAAIVGYYEKLQAKSDVTLEDIQIGWKSGKFPGDYSSVYLLRALKEDLIRQKGKDAYDLTQPGEDFFADLFTDSE